MDDIQKRLQFAENEIKNLKNRRVTQRDILPKEVKQRSIDGLIIFRGAVANRPADGSTQIQAYYAEDQKKLYVWNTANAAWESGTFA